MRMSPHPIGLLPIGEVPVVLPKVVAAHLSGYLDLQSRILPGVLLPGTAFDARRMQYDAGKLLAMGLSGSPEAPGKIIGLLSVDIFVPILTHVFGEARQGGRMAVVSTYRLRQHPDGSTPPQDRVLERTAKVALHELGHLFDLVHCDDARCLMHFSGSVEQLDRLPLLFCRYCRQYFREAVTAEAMPRE